MSFDYPNTCPDIDDNISNFRELLSGLIHDIVSECSPLIESATKRDFADSWVDSIYSDVENIFEEVRRCNSNIREFAEIKISDLEDDIKILSNTIDDLEDDKESLNERIIDLQDEVEYLQTKITDK